MEIGVFRLRFALLFISLRYVTAVDRTLPARTIVRTCRKPALLQNHSQDGFAGAQSSPFIESKNKPHHPMGFVSGGDVGARTLDLCDVNTAL